MKTQIRIETHAVQPVFRMRSSHLPLKAVLENAAEASSPGDRTRVHAVFWFKRGKRAPGRFQIPFRSGGKPVVSSEKAGSTCSIKLGDYDGLDPFYRRPFSAAIPKMSASWRTRPCSTRFQRIPGFRQRDPQDFGGAGFRRSKRRPRGTGTNTGTLVLQNLLQNLLVSAEAVLADNAATALSVPPRDRRLFGGRDDKGVRAEVHQAPDRISGPRSASHDYAREMGLTEKRLPEGGHPSLREASQEWIDDSHPPGSEAPSASTGMHPSGNHGANWDSTSRPTSSVLASTRARPRQFRQRYLG